MLARAEHRESVPRQGRARKRTTWIRAEEVSGVEAGQRAGLCGAQNAAAESVTMGRADVRVGQERGRVGMMRL